jgi:hypothetical protein
VTEVATRFNVAAHILVRGPLRVVRVTLTVCRSLPVCPQQQTFQGTSACLKRAKNRQRQRARRGSCMTIYGGYFQYQREFGFRGPRSSS